MYAYLKQPSKKKPLEELDSEPYLSEHHPRGEDLAELLRRSRKGASLFSSRTCGASGPCPGGQKRKRFSLFEVIQAGNVTTAEELRAIAGKEAIAGNVQLAEFCSRQGNRIEEVVASARSVIEAANPSLAPKKVSLEEPICEHVDL